MNVNTKIQNKCHNIFNQRWIIHEDTRDIPRPRLHVVTIEQPEEEPRVEELIQVCVIFV